MIYVGIDDTDMLHSPGTNQLARELAKRVAARFDCVHIVRHQLLVDPRIPYTSKNSAASITLTPRGAPSLDDLLEQLRDGMRAWFIAGSDPGLSLTQRVPDEVVRFAHRCQTELVRQEEAMQLAARCGVYLEGLGGTQGGVIGALAAVGLMASGNDGRVVQLGQWPDNLSGIQPVDVVTRRGVELRCSETHTAIRDDFVDIGKRLRPNFRDGRPVLFVKPRPPGAAPETPWEAIRLT